MLNLPGNNRRPVVIVLDHPGDKRTGRLQQLRMRGWGQQRAFSNGLALLVHRDKILGIAKILDCPDAHDDLLPGALGRLDLPVKLIWTEDTWCRLTLLPVGPETQHLKRVVQQRAEGRACIQAKRLDLAWAQTDTKQRCATWSNGPLTPLVGQRLG